VHRQRIGAGIDIPKNGFPPLVSLSLGVGKYLVTAKLLVASKSNTRQGVLCTLRLKGTAAPPYDTSEVTLSRRGQPGSMYNMVLHCVVELTAPGGIDMDCSQTGAPGEIIAEYIWMTALVIEEVMKTELS
jgi:hypothetical protein